MGHVEGDGRQLRVWVLGNVDVGGAAHVLELFRSLGGLGVLLLLGLGLGLRLDFGLNFGLSLRFIFFNFFRFSLGLVFINFFRFGLGLGVELADIATLELLGQRHPVHVTFAVLACTLNDCLNFVVAEALSEALGTAGRALHL